MASGTGSAQLMRTSREASIAFAVSHDRDEALRIKVETLQVEMERAMMEKAEMETRLAIEVERSAFTFQDLMDTEEELVRTQGELARVSRERHHTIMTLLAEER